MWAIAGVLLGMLIVTTIAGFHFGPHAHAAATLVGAVTAVFLVTLAFTGHARPLLFVVLGADVAVTGGLAMIAAKGLSGREELMHRPTEHVVGAFATTLDTLDPDGTVRLRGEVWSATALNPPIPAGASVHVVRRAALRLEVWGDTGDDPAELFSIEAPTKPAHTTPHPTDSDAGGERTPSP
jgi:membrane protein implicated in regulation of membrane protease activity